MRGRMRGREDEKEGGREDKREEGRENKLKRSSSVPVRKRIFCAPFLSTDATSFMLAIGCSAAPRNTNL